MGNIFNFIAIIISSLLGFLIGHKFKESMKNIIMECSGLFIIIIGIKSTINSNRDIIVLIYLIIGSILGQLIDIDLKLKNFSLFLENNINFLNKKKLNGIKSEKSFSKGFSTATILFCTGAMAIVGSIKSGLTGDNTTLNIKAILDGTLSIVLTSLYGIGVLFSSISVFLYQGFFYIFANQIKPFLTEQTISDISFLGGIMVTAIGINLLFKKNIKIANMLPALFIPIVIEIF